MKCFKCNSEVLDGNDICSVCGTKLSLYKEEDNLESLDLNDEKQKDATNNNLNLNANTSLKNNNINNGLQNNNSNSMVFMHKKLITIIFIVLILFFGVIGIWGYILSSSSKNVFLKTIDKVYNLVFERTDNEIFNSNTFEMIFDLKINGSTADESSKQFLNMLNKISLNGKAQIDFNNKVFLMNLDSNYDSSSLIKLDTYFKQGKIYLDLNDIYNKKISIDAKELNELFKIKEYYNDIYVIASKLKDILKSSLKDDYFITDKAKMNVNGVEASVDTTTLLLNYDNFNMLMKDILDEIKNDNQFLESLANIAELTKVEILELINDYYDEISDKDNFTDDIKFTIYTKGFKRKFVGFSAELRDNNKPLTFSIINDKKNIYTIKCVDGESVNEMYLERNNDIYTFKYEDESEKVEISLNIKNYDISYSFAINGLNYKGTLTTDEKNNKKLVVSYSMDDDEIVLNLSWVMNYNKNVILPNLEPNIDVNSLSQIDVMNILNKLQEKQAIKNIINEFGNFSNGFYSF